ncbi:hypothetical protein WISP_107956 [Willisornis vidua]|uniref:Uncharacterized protein n=1 Tax=Willisornis vidua TaxID=1566151 RepID=A0ABQ9CWF0_9PASS|nr:hypothetical protein WISP_107956 [Willisornis vidua]
MSKSQFCAMLEWMSRTGGISGLAEGSELPPRMAPLEQGEEDAVPELEITGIHRLPRAVVDSSFLEVSSAKDMVLGDTCGLGVALAVLV